MEYQDGIIALYNEPSSYADQSKSVVQHQVGQKQYEHYGGSGAEGGGYVIEDEDHNFTITTASLSNNGDVGLHYGDPFIADLWILKINSSGDLLWSKVYGGTDTDLPRCIKPAPHGGSYIFGVTASFDHDAIGMHGNSDLYILKLDSMGNKLWHKCLCGSELDGSGYDEGIFAIEDGNGGFYVLNRTESTDGDIQSRPPVHKSDFWLLYIDSVANVIWETTFGGADLQAPTSFCRATDGSFWMGGYSLHTNSPIGMVDTCYGNTDGWVVHADSMGNFINQVVIGADQQEQVHFLQPLPDGNVLAGGRYRTNFNKRSEHFPAASLNGSIDIFLAKLGPQTVDINTPALHQPSFQVYPNPAGKELNIALKNVTTRHTLKVTDMQGRVMMKSPTRNSYKINTGSWPSGYYVVELIQNNNQVVDSQKVLIQH